MIRLSPFKHISAFSYVGRSISVSIYINYTWISIQWSMFVVTRGDIGSDECLCGGGGECDLHVIDVHIFWLRRKCVWIVLVGVWKYRVKYVLIILNVGYLGGMSSKERIPCYRSAPINKQDIVKAIKLSISGLTICWIVNNIDIMHA